MDSFRLRVTRRVTSCMICLATSNPTKEGTSTVSRESSVEGDL